MNKLIIAAIAMLAFYPGNLLADPAKPASKNENNDVKEILRHVLDPMKCLLNAQHPNTSSPSFMVRPLWLL